MYVTKPAQGDRHRKPAAGALAAVCAGERERGKGVIAMLVCGAMGLLLGRGACDPAAASCQLPIRGEGIILYVKAGSACCALCHTLVPTSFGLLSSCPCPCCVRCK
jgi:hypothetical protein